MDLFVLTDGQRSYKFSLCRNKLTTASFVNSSAFVWDTDPAAKPTGKIGAILLWIFSLASSFGSAQRVMTGAHYLEPPYVLYS